MIIFFRIHILLYECWFLLYLTHGKNLHFKLYLQPTFLITSRLVRTWALCFRIKIWSYTSVDSCSSDITLCYINAVIHKVLKPLLSFLGSLLWQVNNRVVIIDTKNKLLQLHYVNNQNIFSSLMPGKPLFTFRYRD